MSALTWVAFIAFGAAGAVARVLVDGLVSARTDDRRPWGTLVVNVSGSFLFGLLTGLGLSHGLPRPPRLVLGTAFCGAYTTFSTFTFETVRLLEEGATKEALWTVIATVAGGAVAAAAGLAVAAI